MTTGAAKPFIIIATAAAALAGVGGYVFVESHRPAVLELFVFDLPGNPAVFIRTPNDRRILIDGGANSEIIGRISGILPFYSRRIDMVIATNDDPANVTGLIDIVNRYQVDKVILPAFDSHTLGLSSSTPIYETFRQTLDYHKVPVQEVSAGQRLALDQAADVNADVLFPIDPGAASSTAFKYSRASPPMIILRIKYGLNSFMLVGNAGLKTQKFIATENTQPADVLIMSNNVNAANLSLELVNAVAPDYLIYSAQANKPAKSSAAPSKSKPKADPLAGIMQDQRFNVREKGSIKIVSDGDSVKISD